ncbi:hypothetical protein UFOVP152_19 [uncultured Caudovirales phage]|uniref:Uncharacterized protein n=1 Tax=uncultured Caudovirales phage TaxID=2100421 RepID=A0A6J7W9B2_9CAUD|nr:hypothetical protein UFOVP152_19 [uncultured Caudovirales phage]
MKLVSMATEADDYPEVSSPSKYGYGLMLRLDEDQCEALGITEALRAGTKVTLQAIGLVTSATESVESDGDDTGPDVCLSIQITDLGVQAQGTASNAATLLFGD